MQTEKLSVVHEDDIATLMSSLGILNKVNDGRIKCKFCQRKTSADNIHSIFPEAGSIKIVCDKL